jgi:hypothetical protein
VPKLTLQYSITFEHDTKPQQTVRGDANTDDPHLALRRALNACEQAHPRSQWRSLVVVLEKIPVKSGAPENEDEKVLTQEAG